MTTIATRRRRLWIVLGMLAAVAAAAFLLVFWMVPSFEATKKFEEPKIVIARVDEEPFLKVPLGPGERYRPIELMAGTRVLAECEVVSIESSRRFTLNAFGRTQDQADCRFPVDVPDEVGRTDSLQFRFYDGGSASATDEIEVPVVVVAPGERLAFHGIEDEAGHPVRDVSVPDRIRIFGTAITHLGDPKKFTALFFVTEPRTGQPVLALNPSRPEDPAPLLAQLVRYRRFGEHLEGYALWTPEPIRIGDPDESRVVSDVYFGLFAKDQVAEVLKKAVQVQKTGPDSVRVTPLLPDVESLRALTVGGRLLSPPLHLVRAAPAVESDRAAPRE